MNARKLSVAAVASAVCMAAIGLGIAGSVAAKPGKGRAATTKLTIEAWPDGAFGYLSSPDPGRCAANRQIVVFEQLGKGRDPGSDRRVAADRAEKGAPYQWSIESTRSGRFYAQAQKAPGCAAALSPTVRSQPVGAPGGGERTAYPPCSPYTSEGVSSICRFDQFHLELQAEGAGKACRFGNDRGECPGAASAGQFPWGETGLGYRPAVRVLWEPAAGRRILTVFSFRADQPNTILARLSGSVPNAGSPRFTVDEGYAQNEKGFPYGDYFYTPNLPGRGPGEPGGPLAINFQNEGGARYGAQVDISGYLYLRQ